jgi:sugar phosphate permease
VADALTQVIPRQRYLRVIPIAFLMYTIAFMDRINIGLAIPSMSKQLHFDPAVAGTAFGIFFLGYLFLQIPGGHIAERWSAKWFVFTLLLVWGCFAILTGFVRNVTELLAVRFLLGIAEGGVWPATLVLLAHWFPREERARANNLWMLCLPFAAVVVSPISGWILAGTHGDYRVLFLAEGLPPILWAVIWVLFMRDYPRQAAGLPEAERAYLERTLERERGDRDRPDLATYRRAFLSPSTWLLCAIYFFSTIPGYGISSFLPSLLKEGGFPIAVVGVLTALPYAMAIAGLLVIGYLSDRHRARRRWVAIPGVITGVGIILSALLSHQVALSLVILILAGFGLYAYLGPFWATVDQVMPPNVAGGTMGLVNAVGNLGGFFGPAIVGILDARTGSFLTGFVFLGAAALVMSALMLQVRVREGDATPAPVSRPTVT